MPRHQLSLQCARFITRPKGLRQVRLFHHRTWASAACAVHTSWVPSHAPRCLSPFTGIGFGSRRLAGTWARADGRRPRALVVHPRIPGDAEELVRWDAAEALALGRALGWRVVGVSGKRMGVDGSEGGNIGEDESDEDSEEDGLRAVGTGMSVQERAFDSAAELVLRVDRIDPRFFFHISDVTRIAKRLAKTGSDVLFVNAELSPVQQRNLEAAMDLVVRARLQGRWSGSSDESDEGMGGSISVFDRHRAVLAIFARRATSATAKLRIEVAEAQQAKAKLGSSAVQGVQAQLQRVATVLARLYNCDSALLLPRSGGARGVDTSFNSSPQKTRHKQKRAVDDKEKRVLKELSRLQKHRSMQRQHRSRLWTIGLAGYTNVGKSAIVNRITGSDLLVRDGVFVTLDIAARRVPLPTGSECYILDSVGFVKDLPVELCDAFAATVEELKEADIVLHVRDMAHPSRDEHSKIVTQVLEDAGIDIQSRVLEVWNKCDLLTEKQQKLLRYIHGKTGGPSAFLVSALQGEGFEELLEYLEQRLQDLSMRRVPGQLSSQGAIEVSQRSKQRVVVVDGLPPDEAAERWAFLQDECGIIEDSIAAEAGATVMDVWMDDIARARCIKMFGTHMLR